jgi:hypothetical protein
LTAISGARVNIEVKKVPKTTTAEVIPKVLKEIYTKAMEVSLRKKVIPKTLSSIIPRDTGSVID